MQSTRGNTQGRQVGGLSDKRYTGSSALVTRDTKGRQAEGLSNKRYTGSSGRGP